MVPVNVPRNMRSPNQQNTEPQEVCHLTLAHLRCSGIVLARLEGDIILAHVMDGVILARLEGSDIPAHLEGSVILTRLEGRVILAHIEGGVILAHLESGITTRVARPESNLVIDPARAHLESSIKALVRQGNRHVVTRGLMVMKLVWGVTVCIQLSITDIVTRHSQLVILNGPDLLNMPHLQVLVNRIHLVDHLCCRCLLPILLFMLDSFALSP
jgi:hypothetical protein